jgi:endonuclease-3 related protein
MTASHKLSPPERLRRLHDLLEEAYGPQHWWPAETPFEVIVGAYLTQNTSWIAAARSIANLRAADALTAQAIHELPIEQLKALIRPSGFATRKAPALKAFVAMLDSEYGGSLDALAATPTASLRIRLLALPGVGSETADAILLYALAHPVPVVDEYLRRIAVRHGLATPAAGHKGYKQLADLVRAAFAADPGAAQVSLLNQQHALVVAAGKAHCRRFPECKGCPLHSDLPFGIPASQDIPNLFSKPGVRFRR